MNKTEFDNPIFEKLIVYNGSLKDLISEFEKANLELSYVHIENLDGHLAKAYKIPKSSPQIKETEKDGLERWGVLDILNNLESHCANFLSLCNTIYNKPSVGELPVYVSILESMDVIENWRNCYKTEIQDYHKYEFLGRVSFFVSGVSYQTTDRLSHISKIVNSYIESTVLTAAAQGVNEVGKTSGGKAKGATAKKRYRKPVIITALITAVATILAPVIVWFLNSYSNKQGVSIQKNVSMSPEVKTTGSLSPAVVTGPNSTVNINNYLTPSQSETRSKVNKMDVNRSK